MNQTLTSVLSEPNAVYDHDATERANRYARADLHCHSLHSDGALTVQELLTRAQQQQLQWFSITDHDCVAGQAEALAIAAQQPDLNYITGVEWSTLWQGIPLHVVGLNFSLSHPSTLEAVACLQQARKKRTLHLVQLLEKKGFHGIADWLNSNAAPNQVGRPHIAQFLVESGQAKSVKQVFHQWLGAGKMGDVKRFWPELAEVVHWIVSAGGIAVLAHPQRYKLSGRKQRDLVAEFAGVGGQAIELGLRGLSPQQRQRWFELALAHDLLGSAGSDFHQDDQPWARLGQVAVIPTPIEPVWSWFSS